MVALALGLRVGMRCVFAAREHHTQKPVHIKQYEKRADDHSTYERRKSSKEGGEKRKKHTHKNDRPQRP